MCCGYAFGGYSVSMRYILGFDGGGTKTECVLMNSADQVLARTYAGPSNPSRIGVESAVRAIEESADLALRDAGLKRAAITAVCGGGAGTAEARPKKRMNCARPKNVPRAPGAIVSRLVTARSGGRERRAIVPAL